jgi:hypothetical protein
MKRGKQNEDDSNNEDFEDDKSSDHYMDGSTKHEEG